MAKEQKFVDASLSEVDISGLPAPLACVAAEVVGDGGHDKSPPPHSYHSDQPQYDHTREN